MDLLLIQNEKIIIFLDACRFFIIKKKKEYVLYFINK